MICRLLFLALLWPLWVGAADWYVRPISGEYGAEDGSSYAAAFDGLGDITWGTGGVEAGDTLYVCGTFLQSSANTGNGNLAMMQVSESGTSGNVITIDGDCSAEGDLSIAILDGDYTSGSVIRLRDSNYITLQNLDLSGAKDSCINNYLDAATQASVARHHTIKSSVTCHDIREGSGNKIGINVSGTNVTIGDYSTTGNKINIYDVGTDAIFYYSGGDGIVDGAHITNVSLDDTNGDCIQLQRDGDGMAINDVYCENTVNDSKQCVVISSLNAQSHAVEVNDLYCVLADGSTQNGVFAEGQTTIRRAYIENPGNFGVVTDLDNSAATTVVGSIVVSPNTGCFQAQKTSAGGTLTAYNNSCYLTTGTGFDLTDATASHVITNNLIHGSPSVGILRGASGTTDTYNAVHGATTPWSDNGVAGTANAGEITSAPLLVGDSNPTTAAGFNTRKGSPLRAAGTIIGQRTDYNGRPFKFPPSIGAMETNSGDEAEERTLRYD